MDKELTKSLNDLIDETLSELEELRKSRFSASEIKIEGPGDGIAGKPSDGDLHAKKAEDDKKKEDKEEDDKEEVEKAANREADPDGGHHKMDKAEDKKDDKKEDKEKEEGSKEHEAKEKKMAKELMDMHKGEMKKSLDEQESLMKAYVDDKIKPLEDKLGTILDLVNKLSEQPVAPKGATARTQPLFKSDAEFAGGEPLSKSQVADKLFELKKSGTYVDSMDIAKAEMGNDLDSLVKKYKIS
jgi:hypothetical protein